MESSEVEKFFIENKEIDINVIQSKIDITSKLFWDSSMKQMR